MSKSCAVTLILILSLTATIYPHQASLKQKAEGVLARLEKLGDSVTVTICHDKDGNVREFAMYGRPDMSNRRTIYREMKEALDAIIPQNLRGELIAFGGGRLPPTGCCDSFRYAYESAEVEEVLMHGEYYEIKVWIRDQRRPGKR